MHDFTPLEMMTVAASRALTSEDTCFVGIGAPSAACNLARMTHAPEITLIYESGTSGAVSDMMPLPVVGELCRASGSTLSVPEMLRYWLQGGRITVGFLGGTQVDPYGNLNSTTVGHNHTSDSHLPAAGGVAEIAVSCQQVFITMKQTRRSFVQYLDFLTSIGHGTGGDYRERAGIDTKGPTLLVTDLGVWVPDPETKEFVVVSLHPGVSKEYFEGTVNWDVQYRDDLIETMAPSQEELEVLRDYYARSEDMGRLFVA